MDIIIKDQALVRLQELAQKHPGHHLRISVIGGGCSGFQYQFALDDMLKSDDHLVTRDGIGVVIDSISLTFVRGAELDFTQDLAGALFVLKNPQATSSCGCGSSFTV